MFTNTTVIPTVIQQIYQFNLLYFSICLNQCDDIDNAKFDTSQADCFYRKKNKALKKSEKKIKKFMKGEKSL